MRLFLIRHGETVDNAAGNYAGVTDSALTNHGALQANRLGQFFADAGVIFVHIFSSDLQRAFKTAEALRLSQRKHSSIATLPAASATSKVSLLRELDFGSYEGKRIDKQSRSPFGKWKEARLETRNDDPHGEDIEPRRAVEARARRFFREYLLSLFSNVGDRYSVAIVSHGIFLTHLWRCILSHFPARNVRVAPSSRLAERGLTLEFPGPWSNTGYLEVQIKQRPKEVPRGNPSFGEAVVEGVGKPVPFTTNDKSSAPLDISLVVNAVNSLEHLKGLKKTGGGIGSSRYHEGQQTIERFFKKRKKTLS